MTSSPGWLVRYRAGERAVVWHELRQLGAAVRDPAHAGDAQAVCDEMARRARHNIEVFVERLVEQGYRFHDNDDAQAAVDPLTGPPPDSDGYLTWLEQTFGPVPVAL